MTATTTTTNNSTITDTSEAKAYILAFGKSAGFVDKHLPSTATLIPYGGDLIRNQAIRDANYSETYKDYTHAALFRFPNYQAAVRWYKQSETSSDLSDSENAEKDFLLVIAEALPSTPQDEMKQGFALGILKIDKPKEFAPYLEKVPSVVDSFGGTLLLKKDIDDNNGEEQGILVDGAKEIQSFSYAVIVAYPTTKRAEEWAGSELYQPIRRIRLATSHGPFLVLR